MEPSTIKKPSLKKVGAIRRRVVSSSHDSLVAMEPLSPESQLPLLVRPGREQVRLSAWLQGSKALIGERLNRYGGILFRDFKVDSIQDFQECVRILSGELLDYTYRSTPRSEVEGQIYTSTEYPAELTIPQHNEMSYSRNWPLKIWFYSIDVADRGGETPISPSRAVFERIPPEIREEFQRKRVAYVRNYGKGVDLSWQNVFQTDDKAQVAAFCEQQGIEFQWRGTDGLWTRQVAQAVATHPTRGDVLWFNQAHLFHHSSLAPEARRLLLEQFSVDELPRNAVFGDGSAIDDAIIAEIRAAYDAELVTFPWQTGDILLLDNMLVGHGRRPFSGSRKVVVGMAEAHGDA